VRNYHDLKSWCGWCEIEVFDLHLIHSIMSVLYIFKDYEIKFESKSSTEFGRVEATPTRLILFDRTNKKAERLATNQFLFLLIAIFTEHTKFSLLRTQSLSLSLLIFFLLFDLFRSFLWFCFDRNPAFCRFVARRIFLSLNLRLIPNLVVIFIIHRVFNLTPIHLS